MYFSTMMGYPDTSSYVTPYRLPRSKTAAAAAHSLDTYHEQLQQMRQKAATAEQLALRLGAKRYAQTMNNLDLALLTFLCLCTQCAMPPQTGADKGACELIFEAGKALYSFGAEL